MLIRTIDYSKFYFRVYFRFGFRSSFCSDLDSTSGWSDLSDNPFLRNTELGNLAENLEINVPPVTVSYVREDDQKLMEGIQQLLNRLNGGNVEITDQMVKDALALIKEYFRKFFEIFSKVVFWLA